MSSVTINGNTYSADGSTPKDMLNGGHRTHFIPLCADVATVAGQVQVNADQVAIDAVNATDGANAVRGTSTTSLTVGAGVQVLTTQAGKQFAGGNYVTISRTSAPTTLMHGVVTNYTGTALTVDVSTVAGGGTFTDWTIALSGAKGSNGPSGSGDLPRVAKTSAYTVLSTDKGKLIDCSGTFTLSFSACATLGADWATYIKNSGTGPITLDPDGAETINGEATYTLTAGTMMLLHCDGTTLRTVLVAPAQLIRNKIFDPATNNMIPVSALENITPPTFSTGLSGFVNQCIFGSSLFVAASNTAQSNVATSADGEVWTLRAMPSSKIWTISTNGSDKFIATVGGETTTAKSTNGTSWSAATPLPVAVGYSRSTPAFNGSTCLVFVNASVTNFVSTDNGASWSSAQTLPANSTTSPFAIGGLFWYYAGGTTAYTSATGLTGSWTARTLPITPGVTYIHKTAGGAIAIAVQATGAPVYETYDGISFSLANYVSGAGGNIPLNVNGVYATYATTTGECTTQANSVSAVRISRLDLNTGMRYASSGTKLLIPAGTGIVAAIDTTDMPQTALFTR